VTKEARKKILVIHGPNLNLLGKREREIYGRVSLEEINGALEKMARDEGIAIEFFQSNHEGELVSRIQEAEGQFGAIVLNPAAFTHTSVALRDVIAAVTVPVIEVHLSNIHAREDFRKISHVSPVARGVIFGFGKESYCLGLKGAIEILKQEVGNHVKREDTQKRRKI
jgi:3-dehydroquinate dehydratase-2